MTALPPDNRGAAADRFTGVEVATGDELFESGETPLPLGADEPERSPVHTDARGY